MYSSVMSSPAMSADCHHALGGWLVIAGAVVVCAFIIAMTWAILSDMERR